MSETWRLLPYHFGSTAFHFALSDALARHVTLPTVWWHSTESPTVILGPTQTSDDLAPASRSVEAVRVVKRHAGGTAVFATRAVLGLDVALPESHRLAVPDIVEAYRWIGQIWVDATTALGAQAHLVSIQEARDARKPTGLYADLVRRACFGSLSPYEVAVGQRKLVGLAQVRRRGGVLLQAGLHLELDAEGMARLLHGEARPEFVRALQTAAIGLVEATGARYEHQAVIDSFHQALEERQAVILRPGSWTEEEWNYALAHARQMDVSETRS